MIDQIFRKALERHCLDFGHSVIVLDNPAFDGSIVGLTDDGRLVYDYDSMARELANEFADDEDPETSALEWLDTNTMPSIRYMGDKAPIVITAGKDVIVEGWSD